MADEVQAFGYTFPYLFDASREVAKVLLYGGSDPRKDGMAMGY